MTDRVRAPGLVGGSRQIGDQLTEPQAAVLPCGEMQSWFFMEREEITATLASRLVAAQFPQWAELPVSPVAENGWDNVTFRLGESMSVRLPTADGYAAQVDKEHTWLPILSAQLPLPVPEPLARGEPGFGYPWPWSVYRWLPGARAAVEGISDLRDFATELGLFLAALHRIDTVDGPPPSDRSFFRGGPLSSHDDETRAAIAALEAEIDTHAATEAWDSALAVPGGRPVWIHADVSPRNLLVLDGRLSAVIDFGCAGVGDAAFDTEIAWGFLSGDSRAAFRASLGVDDATWARARGWALWGSLPTLVEGLESNADWVSWVRRVVEDVLVDHASGA